MVEVLDAEAVIDELPASLAGCGDGASSAWLYFYKYDATASFEYDSNRVLTTFSR